MPPNEGLLEEPINPEVSEYDTYDTYEQTSEAAKNEARSAARRQMNLPESTPDELVFPILEMIQKVNESIKNRS